jgi:DNA mismatch repair ATPase MutS
VSALVHDAPDGCFATIDDSSRQIDAQQIGHPMLRDEARVANDITVGPPGSTLLVTGSNMSGKSTLLRSIGVNTVLAQAGAPVCARAYRAPVLRLYTSVNVRDSLAAGVSLYMAQLKRIKSVLDAAEENSPELCCYLLDEILSGTNSADRTTAVRGILHRLLELPAIGALATHDLALATDEKIRAAAHTIHFQESIAQGVMTFDYRIKEGPLQSTNALKLLELMGIRV